MTDSSSLYHFAKCSLVSRDSLPPVLKKARKHRILEISRRFDAAVILPQWLPALIRKDEKNIHENAMLKIPYLLDLTQFDVLVLWTKDPASLARLITKEDEATGDALVDVWPIIYVVATLNADDLALEPRVPGNKAQGLIELAQALRTPPCDSIYVKIGDPLVEYLTKDGEKKDNYSEVGDILDATKALGIKKVHYGPLDTRKRWAKAKEMAKEEANITLIDYNIDAPFGSPDDNITPAVAKLQRQAESRGIKLVTCGDKQRIGKVVDPAFPNRKIRTGICVALPAINKLLKAIGAKPIAAKGTTKPKGGRDCECQDTYDIGQYARRYSPNEIDKCHACAYCFVRATHGVIRDIEDIAEDGEKRKRQD